MLASPEIELCAILFEALKRNQGAHLSNKGGLQEAANDSQQTAPC